MHHTFAATHENLRAHLPPYSYVRNSAAIRTSRIPTSQALLSTRASQEMHDHQFHAHTSMASPPFDMPIRSSIQPFDCPPPLPLLQLTPLVPISPGLPFKLHVPIRNYDCQMLFRSGTSKYQLSNNSWNQTTDTNDQFIVGIKHGLIINPPTHVPLLSNPSTHIPHCSHKRLCFGFVFRGPEPHG